MPEFGTSLAYARIPDGGGVYPVMEFWPSRNSFGRKAAHAHYVYAPFCPCMREFIFYSSADWACYNDDLYNTTSNPLWGYEVMVRRWLDGPPAQGSLSSKGQ